MGVKIRVLMVIIVLSCFNLFGAEGITLYVSADGNDGWSGTLPQPNRRKTDGPLATIESAKNRIRKLKEQWRGGELPPVTVYLRGGIYFLKETLVFEPVDSGSPLSPVTYAAYRDEKPIIAGAIEIKNWSQYSDKLWVAQISEVASGGLYFNQLFVNGERRTRARSPNDGWFRIAGFAPPYRDGSGKETPRSRDAFIFKSGDIKQWNNLEDANIILFHSWETSIHPIKSVSLESNLVEFTAPLKEWWTIGYWEKQQRYIVDNVFEALDSPGEWYLERKTGKLYYYPMHGERIGKTTALAPKLIQLIKFSGDPDKGNFISNIKFRGITFHYSDWTRDPKGNSSTQAAIEAPAACVLDGAKDCAFEQCEFAHTGGYAVWLRRGCKNCRIEQCRLFDVGAGGIRVGEDKMSATDAGESTGNVIFNNHIYDGGYVFPAGVGIWVAQSSSNLISNNEIHDLLYTGISVGWNWDDSKNRTHHNIIQFNHIHHLVKGVLSDAGGIYTLGVSPGSVIRNNIIHDIFPYENPPFGWGIYLDATCGNYLVESNIVYYTRSGGLMYNNGGHEHIIRNNIFALSASYAIWPFFEKRPNTFQHNIVYMTQGELFVPYGETSFMQRISAKESPGLWDNNLYWDTRGADNIKFFRNSFERWRAFGMDSNSIIADPLFEAPEKGDFRLKRNSPAFTIGFKPIDVSNVGLCGSTQWRRETAKFKFPKTILPPVPPKPTPKNIIEDFEKVPVDGVPDGMTVSGTEMGASIAVTAERAATGKHSLKIVDSRQLKPSWQPHFYYQPHFVSGKVIQSFDIYLEPENELFTEWRDNRAYPENIGPSIQFDGEGRVKYKGKVLATVPVKQWVYVEITADTGKNNSGKFTLVVSVAGQKPQVFNDLQFIGSQFEELHWIGFSSTASADTTFYIDNLRIIKR